MTKSDENRQWTVCRVSGVTWHVAPGFEEEFGRLVETHASGGQWRDVVALKEDKGTRVTAVGDWVIKEGGRRRGRSILRFGLRRSGARRAFVLGRRLVACGVATPEPMAWATTRYLGLRTKDYLITRRVEDVESLTERCRRLTGDKVERTRTLRVLGELIAAFHRSGYSNRDMKDENILCFLREPLRMWVVDMDGVREVRVLTRRRARRDLWPIARSLRRLGWDTEADAAAFLEGYNSVVAKCLRLEAFPYLHASPAR